MQKTILYGAVIKHGKDETCFSEVCDDVSVFMQLLHKHYVQSFDRKMRKSDIVMLDSMEIPDEFFA